VGAVFEQELAGIVAGIEHLILALEKIENVEFLPWLGLGKRLPRPSNIF